MQSFLRTVLGSKNEVLNLGIQVTQEFFQPAFLDTGLLRGNVHERESGPMRGAIPTQSHDP